MGIMARTFSEDERAEMAKEEKGNTGIVSLVDSIAKSLGGLEQEIDSLREDLKPILKENVEKSSGSTTPIVEGSPLLERLLYAHSHSQMLTLSITSLRKDLNL